MTNYIFVKDGIITQTLVLDNPSNEILNEYKAQYDADEVAIDETPNAMPGSSWDGAISLRPKPHPSWVLDEFNQWVTPVPYPVATGGEVTELPQQDIHVWNESNTSWVKIDPYPSWTLDSYNQWAPPVPYPVQEKSDQPFDIYEWDESKLNWVKTEPYPSWSINASGEWEAPTKRPWKNEGNTITPKIYEWNESIRNWVEKRS